MAKAKTKDTEASQASDPFLITGALLTEWKACISGLTAFTQQFPQGATYADVINRGYELKLYADTQWLTREVWTRWFEKPGLCDVEVAADCALIETATAQGADTVSDKDGSRLAASGNDSRLAASGYDSALAASGNGSTLAASGNGSTLAASGNDSRLAASGYDSRLAASGNDSALAASGNGSRFTLGENGCAAIAYWDGKRTRFAVAYVGENVEAGKWYRANERGEFVECAP